MCLSMEAKDRLREAAFRIATEWQLDPHLVEAELLREPSAESVEQSFVLFDEIEERLHRLAAFDKTYVDNFWREPRWDGRSPSERLGAAGDANVLEELTEELWEAEEVFEFMSGRR